jgi:hypothetical protein
MNRILQRPLLATPMQTLDPHMATELQAVLSDRPVLSVERERELARMANGIVDAVYSNCQGNLGEVAVVLSSALVSVLRSWPREAGCEMLAKVGRLLHRTLWTCCSE